MIFNQYNVESNKLLWISEGTFQSKLGLEVSTEVGYFIT